MVDRATSNIVFIDIDVIGLVGGTDGGPESLSARSFAYPAADWFSGRPLESPLTSSVLSRRSIAVSCSSRRKHQQHSTLAVLLRYVIRTFTVRRSAFVRVLEQPIFLTYRTQV